MRPIALATLAMLALAACREDEQAALPAPVAMTDAATGFFCQMIVADHSGPKAQIHLDGLPAPIFFSQVRDAVAYQRLPEQAYPIRAIYVSDMGAAPGWHDVGADNWINAKAAHYVVGSDATGGMGTPELVPFADPAAAATFVAAHGGKVLSLDLIPEADVLGPVPVGTPVDGDDAAYLERLRALSVKEEG